MISIYFNPSAGSGRAQRVWKEVRAFLDARRVTYQLWEPDSEAQDILVIGGDGTFNTLLNTIPQPEKHRFILLAAGTSNSLCSQISPNQKPVDKVKRYLSGVDFQSVDLPELTCGKKTWRFVNEASAGFAASIAGEIEKRKTKKFFNALHLNELAYITTAFRCWCKEEPVMLSLCNNRRISGNLFPCPKAQLNDGRIDIYHLTCPRLRLPFELTRLIGATADKPSPYVTRHQTNSESWHWDKALPVEIDGNPIGETCDVRLSIYPDSIQVL